MEDVPETDVTKGQYTPDEGIEIKHEVPETLAEEALSAEEGAEPEPLKLPNLCGCSVEELLDEPYLAREFSRTLEIIQKGRPTPNLAVSVTSSGSACKRSFKDHYYDKVEWLTGCEALSKLFCWPCLLFDRVPSTWNRNGFEDIYNFHKAFRRHENSQNHIVASMQLVAFVMNHCEGRVREDAEERNTAVRANRDSLKRVIEAVGAVGGPSLSPCMDSKLLLRLARREFSLLRGISDLHVSVLSSVNIAFNETLMDLIKESPFLSVLLDETQEGRIAIVLRYTTCKGELQDTFVGFMEGDDLSAVIARLQARYNLGGKLVSILLGSLSRVETLPREMKAILLHSPFHRMSAVIPRALRHLKECAAFFHILHCFEQWLKDSHVEEEIKARVPNCNILKWRERPVTALQEHREMIQDLVHNLLDKPTAWNPSAYTSALALQHALEDLEFTFLLRVFKELLPVTDALLEMVLSNSPNLKVCSETVEDYIKVLNWKKEKFDEIWESVQETDLEGPATKKPRHVGTSRLVAYYRSLYELIVDAVVRQVEMRFGSIRYLEFAELLDIKETERNAVSEKQMIQLRSKRDDFETGRLRNELFVAYAQVDFKGLQCEQLLRHLYETGLSGPLRQVVRLARFILVLPYASKTSLEPSLKLINTIHKFSKDATADPRLLPWATVTIENKLLNKLIQNDSFLDRAVGDFAIYHDQIDFTPFKPKTL